MLHAGDGERCNPTLKHVLNSASDPVITHEDIIRKAASREAQRLWTDTTVKHQNNKLTKCPVAQQNRLESARWSVKFKYFYMCLNYAQ